MARYFKSTEYHDAHTFAVQLARKMGKESQIRKTREYGKLVYAVELYCVADVPHEIVHPSDPICATD